MITLTRGANTVALPGDLEWIDEQQWSAITGTAEYSLGGTLIVEEAVRQAGRPITLSAPRVNRECWVTRATVAALRAFDVLGAELTLVLEDGREFACTWRRADGEPIDAQPVWYAAPPADTDPCYLTLRLMEI